MNSIGLALFLWFLGSLWTVLRSAEGGPARGSAIASAGALVGVAATLGGFAEVILRTGVIGKWLGVLALLASPVADEDASAAPTQRGDPRPTVAP